jgi:hypothetical protein
VCSPKDCELTFHKSKCKPPWSKADPYAQLFRFYRILSHLISPLLFSLQHSIAGRGGHIRDHHQARTGQRRLRGCAHHHGQRGHRAHGHRTGAGQDARQRRGASGHLLAAARLSDFQGDAIGSRYVTYVSLRCNSCVVHSISLQSRLTLSRFTPVSCVAQAKGIVFNIVGGSDMTLQEINAAAEVIYSCLH